MGTAARDFNSNARDVARAAFVRLAEEAREWLPHLATQANAEPIGDRVLVMMIDEPTQDVLEEGNETGGRLDEKTGLYIVQDKRAMWRALVLRAAPGVEEKLLPGDCIILGEHVGQKVPIDEIDLRLVKVHDVLARFVPPTDEPKSDDAAREAFADGRGMCTKCGEPIAYAEKYGCPVAFDDCPQKQP